MVLQEQVHLAHQPLQRALPLRPLQHRLLRMQHLQKQPHPRIHLYLVQQSRPRHPIVLYFQACRLYSVITKQAHQHAHKFNLREFAAGAIACATGPTDEGTVTGGWLLQVLHRTR